MLQTLCWLIIYYCFNSGLIAGHGRALWGGRVHGRTVDGLRDEAWSTVMLLMGSVLRPGLWSHSAVSWGLVVNIGSPWNCEWETRKTPGRGSPDVELVAGLTGALYSINYKYYWGTNPHCSAHRARQWHPPPTSSCTFGHQCKATVG